ncbi:MAG: metallophosphoesterase [Thermoanaerobaculia bacterium]|nr:metallophosphoesterase [Thermoanaerobaculia bacterium]
MTSGRPLTFLQSSDWHLGSALTGGGLSFTPEVRAARRDEVDAAAERAVAAAASCGAEALLVPGDLWDAENVPPATIHRLLEAFASFAPRPVFVAPGNHDFAGPGGYYDPTLLSALGMRPWPENVVVFRGPEWAAVPFPGRDDVAVVGRAFLSSAAVVERPLAPPPPRPSTPHALLLLHGSLESYAGPDSPRGTKRTAPFSANEVAGAGFSWVALGHHHHDQVVSDEEGRPCGAYAGCPTGRGLDEAGPRFFLRVTLPAGGSPPVVEKIPADTRVVRDLAVDVSELDAGPLAEKVEATFRDAGVEAPDLVRVTLTGTQAFGARPADILRPLALRVRHLAVRDQTEPPAPDPEPRSAEGRFTTDLLAVRAGAADDAQRRVADLALRLGRDALLGRPIRPPEAEDR